VIERWSPTGATRLAGVIGHPIRHSRSPAICNAAFAAAGLDWVYVAFDVADGGAPAALDAVRALGLGGLSVTMPHKHAVAAAVDRLTPEARALDAVNCVVPDGTELVGHNTDGAGLLRSLAADAGFDPAGRSCVVVGAGGAGRAVAAALAGAGAASVAVVNRTAGAGTDAAALAGPVGRYVGGAGADDAVAALAAADLVVHATSVGMGTPSGADGPRPFDPATLHAGQVVVDIVYQPLHTPLLAAAAAQGATVVDGLGMLVHQAAVAFELWTGVEAPVAAMAEAARTAGTG
jgi:shikimate dehydrogenase